MHKNISNFVLIFFTILCMGFPLCAMEKEDENNCIICYDTAPEKELIDLHKKLIGKSVTHPVHLECINSWRRSDNENRKKCPLCFVEVPDENINKPQFIHNSFNDKSQRVKENLNKRSFMLLATCLSLPWIFSQDVSSKGLITKGLMAAGFYCALTPYGTSPQHRLFSFERLKRLMGYTLILGSYISTVNPITPRSCLFHGASIATALEFACLMAQEKSAQKGDLLYSARVDVNGAILVGFGIVGFIEHKTGFLKKNVSLLFGSKPRST